MTGAAVERRWLVLAGLALGVTVTHGFARLAYGLLLPAMRSELGWTYSQAGWLNTANAIGYLAGAVLTMLLIRHISPARLFAFGMTATALAMLATGLHAGLTWQTFWRFAVGLLGALSFSTAGTLAAGLFPDDTRRSALAIAILFGVGGGLGVVLTGGSVPLMLDTWGPASWPAGWLAIGVVSLCALPLSLWAASGLHAPVQQAGQAKSMPLPVRRMLPVMACYACFGGGYFVYLTFLSAWMTEQRASAGLIALVWVVLGTCICLSPFVWRRVLARHASGLPMALIMVCVAIGTALPVVVPKGTGLMVSAVVFGISVFMQPGAGANFVRQNLPPKAWGSAISLMTLVFAIAQIAGPYAAGLLADLSGDIGVSLLAAAAVLLIGAALALLQKPLQLPVTPAR
ncbi:MAG: YbfB/YjiJ family MFS transporter [Burkholderiales bacterium]|nr:MAG: YbfB/YjiJ family MFS transporter [Burkholderiales bacterium]